VDPAERRRRQAESMRRLRAKREREKRWAGFSFDEICMELRIVPSPQSCLNPQFWNSCVMYEGLHPRTMK
jgi:hypothetical protein